MSRRDNDQEDPKLAKKIKNFIYHPTDMVGSGFSSQVFKGFNEDESDPDKKVIAIKVIELAKVQNEVEKYLFNNEVNALKALKHPNVLQTIDILMTKNNVYLITEFCEGGDLLKLIKTHGSLSELAALRTLADIVEGYIAVEETHIVHRDLKTANIFLKNGVAKIADFGFCEFIGDKKPEVAYNVGSPAYMSPESYKQNQYSAKSDIWAIGIILYEILVGETPYKNLTYTEMAANLMSERINHISNEEIRRILCLCFKRNVNERVGSRNLLELVKVEISRLEGNSRKPGLNQSIQPPISQTPINQANRSHVLQARLNSPTKNKQPKYLVQDNQNQPPRIYRFSQVIEEANVPNRKLKTDQANFQGNRGRGPVLKSKTEMLLFLYRLLKFLGTQTNLQKLHSTYLVVFRHRIYIESLVENSEVRSSEEEYQEFQYLKNRFDEVYWQICKQNQIRGSYHQSMDKFANSDFLDPNALNLYRQILRQACGDSLNALQKKEGSNLNSLGVIMDYMMIEYEILGLHLEGFLFQDIVSLAKLEVLVREQPKTLTATHIELIKYKFNMVINKQDNSQKNIVFTLGSQNGEYTMRQSLPPNPLNPRTLM